MLNRGMRLVVVAATVAAAFPAHAAVHLGWVRAGATADPAHPARYYPGHLLDGDRHTVTCVAGGPAGAGAHAITIGLRGTGRITAVLVDNGDPRTRRDARAHNRVHALVLTDATASRTLTLPDSTKPQLVKLGTPIQGEKVTLTIKSVYGTAPLTCLAGVTFVSGRRHLVARHLRYDRQRAPLEGVWAAGPKGAPERFLALYLDGRYRFTYAPNDPDAKGARLEGRWTRRGHRLRLQVHGRWVTLRLGLTGRQPAASGQAHRHLKLTGPRRLPKHLAGDYRDHWL